MFLYIYRNTFKKIFMEHGLLHILIYYWFWHKRKIDNFDPHNVFLAIATNIATYKTGFVFQGHMLHWNQ